MLALRSSKRLSTLLQTWLFHGLFARWVVCYLIMRMSNEFWFLVDNESLISICNTESDLHQRRSVKASGLALLGIVVHYWPRYWLYSRHDEKLTPEFVGCGESRICAQLLSLSKFTFQCRSCASDRFCAGGSWGGVGGRGGWLPYRWRLISALSNDVRMLQVTRCRCLWTSWRR